MGVIARNIGHAIGLTLLAAAMLFGLKKTFQAIDRLAERQLKQRIESLEEKSLKLVQAKQVWGMLRQSLSGLRVVLVLLIVYVYLNAVLSLFLVTRELGNWPLTLIVDPIIDMAQGLVGYIPSFIFLVVIVLFVRYLLRSLKGLFAAIQNKTLQFKTFDAEWAVPTYSLVRMAVIALALVVAYPYIPGSQSEAFKGMS